MFRSTVMGCRPRCGRMERSVRLDERDNETGSSTVDVSLHVSMRWRLLLGDNFTSLEEVEDLAIEAVKIILHRDTEKPRQLGVDLDIPEVATSRLLVSRWVPRFWGAWRHEQKHTSAGSACTVDVTSASRTQCAWRDVRQILIVGHGGTLGKFSS